MGSSAALRLKTDAKSSVHQVVHTPHLSIHMRALRIFTCILAGAPSWIKSEAKQTGRIDVAREGAFGRHCHRVCAIEDGQ